MKAEDLAGALLQTKQLVRSAIFSGKVLGAARAVSTLKRIKEPLDRGHYRSAWRAIIHGVDLVEVVNDSPIAGVIELGARPHPVSEEGKEAIREWVIRKGIIELMKDKRLKKGMLGPRQRVARPLTRAEGEGEFAYLVDEVVAGVVHKLATKGQQGHFIVLHRIEQFTRDVKTETDRQIRKALVDKR